MTWGPCLEMHDEQRVRGWNEKLGKAVWSTLLRGMHEARGGEYQSMREALSVAWQSHSQDKTRLCHVIPSLRFSPALDFSKLGKRPKALGLLTVLGTVLSFATVITGYTVDAGQK